MTTKEKLIEQLVEEFGLRLGDLVDECGGDIASAMSQITDDLLARVDGENIRRVLVQQREEAVALVERDGQCLN
jgi:hypothetical protein